MKDEHENDNVSKLKIVSVIWCDSFVTPFDCRYGWLRIPEEGHPKGLRGSWQCLRQWQWQQDDDIHQEKGSAKDDDGHDVVAADVGGAGEEDKHDEHHAAGHHCHRVETARQEVDNPEEIGVNGHELCVVLLFSFISIHYSFVCIFVSLFTSVRGSCHAHAGSWRQCIGQWPEEFTMHKTRFILNQILIKFQFISTIAIITIMIKLPGRDRCRGQRTRGRQRRS